MYAFADSARSFIPLVIYPWWGAVLAAAPVVVAAAAFANPVAPAWAPPAAAPVVAAAPVGWFPAEAVA